MATKIFESYYDFTQRGDKKVNGVSKEFAEDHKDYKEKNKTNEGCWNCSDCYGCSDCSDCYGCSGCYRCYRCYRCSDCSGCSGFSDCSDCYGCSGCSGCSGLRWKDNIKEQNKTTTNPISGFPNVPVIENIHQKLYATIKPNGHDNKLDMGAWHTCETTHCRAGWVTFLAGKEGKELEEKTSTQFAAMQIYKASSPIKVSPPRFFEDNKTAMADIKRCAEEESKLIAK